MHISREHGFGWYFWAWSDGEEFHYVVNTHDYNYSGPEDLTPAGQIFSIDNLMGSCCR